MPPTPDAHPNTLTAERPADGLDRAILATSVVLFAVYVWLFLDGVRFMLVNTAAIPMFLLYGALLRQRVRFAADWLPLLTATVLFDAVRGAIYLLVQRGYLSVHVGYVIAIERVLFLTPALAIPLQHWRTPMLDDAAVLLHASHFVFFLLFGVVLWHTRRHAFGEFQYALYLVMAAGLAGYLLVPTAPPWLAFEALHRLPFIAHVTADAYGRHIPGVYRVFDTNPVAAMPSLHAAFPALCAIVGWRSYGRTVRLGLVAYALATMIAAVYLGEHFGTDVLAGAAVAAASVALARRRGGLRPLAIEQSVLAAALGLCATFALLLLAR